MELVSNSGRAPFPRPGGPHGATAVCRLRGAPGGAELCPREQGGPGVYLFSLPEPPVSVPAEQIHILGPRTDHTWLPGSAFCTALGRLISSIKLINPRTAGQPPPHSSPPRGAEGAGSGGSRRGWGGHSGLCEAPAGSRQGGWEAEAAGLQCFPTPTPTPRRRTPF